MPRAPSDIRDFPDICLPKDIHFIAEAAKSAETNHCLFSARSAISAVKSESDPSKAARPIKPRLAPFVVLAVNL